MKVHIQIREYGGAYIARATFAGKKIQASSTNSGAAAADRVMEKIRDLSVEVVVVKGRACGKSTALSAFSPASPGFAVGGRAIYIDRGRKVPKFIDGEEV